MSRQDGRDRQVSAASVDSSTATILHVDLDAFFASVELLDRPDLADKPVVVAGDSVRSVVTAANYPARRYGVRSAISLGRALSLCPHAIVLPPHFERYRHYSRIVMGIFDDVTPLVERVGIDEAFLDVAGAVRLLGSPAQIGAMIRSRVEAETRLTCSVGAASLKFVAKMASGRAKPDGMLVVPEGDTLAFLHPLPVSSLWGVGDTTAEILVRRGWRTIGDVAGVPEAVLQRAVGEAAGSKLSALANGRDPRRVSRRVDEKSVGHEVTFEANVADAAVLRRELLRQADAVAVRLRKGGFVGRTVVLKLRYGDFTTITRSRTIAEPTDLGRRIYEEVRQVYDALGAHEPVRLIGVRMEQLSAATDRSDLLWDEDETWRETERMIDGVAERFGRAALRPASLIRPATHLVQRGELGDVRRPPRAGD